jgi:SOS-response transcriptional repressor LexA
MAPTQSGVDMNNNDSRRDDADETLSREDDGLIKERHADALMRIAAERAFNELVPDDPRNVPFFEWLARDARLRQSPVERADTERQAEDFGRRMAKRWLTEMVTMRDETGPPPLRAAPVETTTAHALELASASAMAPYLDLAVAAGVGRELWDEACAEWVNLPADLPPGKHLALRVAGDSMTPALHDGDTLLMRLAEPGDVPETGRIVVARRPDDGYVVKRLGRVDRRALELVSLNPAFPAIRVARRPGTILGTVILRWCMHR